ncbi:DUF2614 family zinc ribbon-containing protein [Paenibacillus cymbidii]|uniref:DUF2614 family zinc ribbon-containing protein n=1 Tax=Paenibacillus cymbidii TaxID=1639034 RepID=UPI0010807083|nr:DUF2614 family zinc ribbon-containing protein [Paenibacillus cymbidii]
MLLKSSKVNEFRLWGLLLTMFGLLLMVLGMAGIVFDWGSVGKVIAAICLILGLISVMASMAIYFWAGMLSTSAVSLECPECGRMTKVLGKTDRCMFCKTILTFDPKLANASASDTHAHGQENNSTGV